MSKVKINLEWDDGDGLVKQGILIPENTPSKVIEQAMEIALATGEDEVAKFIEVFNAYGYEAEIEEIKVAYTFSCPILSEETQAKLEDEEEYMKLLEQIKNSSEKERDILFESLK